MPKDKNDKSKFLKGIGFTLENWEELKEEILHIAENNSPVFQTTIPFGGDLYEINGNLRGKVIVTIWILKIDKDTFRFITLFPKNNRNEI